MTRSCTGAFWKKADHKRRKKMTEVAQNRLAITFVPFVDVISISGENYENCFSRSVRHYPDGCS
jgi:hypothetical protein